MKCSMLAELSRWSYFVIAILSVMNAFIHLHIQFEMISCPDKLSESESSFPHSSCIGRNLAWRKEDYFDYDTNKELWRQIFSFQPHIFFDIWPPIIVSMIALLQHFDTFKFELISGDWGRSLIFIVIWQLFCVLGYGSNFGVIVGFVGLCGVAFLYLLICISLLMGCADIDIRDKPVLDLTEYIMICWSVGDNIKKRRNSDAATINHDNDDEQHPFHHHHHNDNDNNNNNNFIDNDDINRLSVTQPGSEMGDNKNNKYNHSVSVPPDGGKSMDITPGGIGGGMNKSKNKKKRRNLHYNEIEQSGDSNDDESVNEELKQNEYNQYENDKNEANHNNESNKVLIPPPVPDIPYDITYNTTAVETGNEAEIVMESDSDNDDDKMYEQPDRNQLTQQ